MKDAYRGDVGRKTLRMGVVSMRDRDGLHGRLEFVRCPVLWMHVSTLAASHYSTLLSINTEVLGYHGCTNTNRKSGSRNQIVHGFERCSFGCHRRRSARFELLASAGG